MTTVICRAQLQLVLEMVTTIHQCPSGVRQVALT